MSGVIPNNEVNATYTANATEQNPRLSSMERARKMVHLDPPRSINDSQDHCVRVMSGAGAQAGAEVAFSASVDAPVGALCAFSGSGNGADKVRTKSCIIELTIVSIPCGQHVL